LKAEQYALYLAAIGTTPFDLDLSNIWIVIGLLLGIAIFKAIAMTTTFGAGGVGGVFIPTLVMGSVLGNAFAKIINNLGLDFQISESNFTLIGMTGFCHYKILCFAFHLHPKTGTTRGTYDA